MNKQELEAFVVVEWQSRPLEAMCPIVYLDCIEVKIRHKYLSHFTPCIRQEREV